MHIEVVQKVLAAGFDAPGMLSVVFQDRNIHLSPGVLRERVWRDEVTEWLKTHNKTAAWETNNLVW